MSSEQVSIMIDLLSNIEKHVRGTNILLFGLLIIICIIVYYYDKK